MYYKQFCQSYHIEFVRELIETYRFLYLLFVWVLLFVRREQVDPNTVIYNTMGTTWTTTHNLDQNIINPRPFQKYTHSNELTCLIVQTENVKILVTLCSITIGERSCTSLLHDSSNDRRHFNIFSSSQRGNFFLMKQVYFTIRSRTIPDSYICCWYIDWNAM